jgi:hypothetical protein
VRHRHEISSRLLHLATLQDHVITREQALAHGLSRHSVDRLVVSGAWRRLASGIFLTVPLEPSWDSLAWAGILLGGESARLGPESSGFLHHVLPEVSNPVDVLVPRTRRIDVNGPWRFIRERPAARPARSVGNPPRLTVESTVLDLAEARDAGEVVALITTAVQRRLLVDVDEGAESPIELRYLRDVERTHGLPKGQRQQSRSGLPFQTDVDYKEFGLIVELDGRVDHEGFGRFRDMDRDNRHALVHALTLRYGLYDLASRPCGVAFQVYRALAERGYLEVFLRCRRCSTASEVDLLLA